MQRTCKKMLVTALLGGFAAAGVAAPAQLVSQSFEYEGTESKDVKFFTATGVGAEAGNVWSGFGTVTNQATAYSYTKPAGRPISGTASGVATAKILAVEGQVACAVPTYQGTLPAQVDMMVQIAKPEEALPEYPAEENGTPVQIALGVNPDGKLCLWCKTSAGNAWNEISDAKTEGEWVRVTMLCDYAAQRCQVRLDGEPCKQAFGYATATATEAGNGSWFDLATKGATGAPTQITKLEVIGMTALDEVVVKMGDAAQAGGEPVYPGTPMAQTKTSAGVEYSWLDANNLAWDTDVNTVASDNSGLTLAQKSVAGFGANDGKKFEVETMKMETVTGQDGVKKTQVVLNFPEVNPAPGYKLQVAYGTSKDNLGATADVALESGGASSATIEIDGNANLFYYQLKMVPEQPLAQ